MGKTGGYSRNRVELGHFLRTKRSSLAPADIGLSVSSGKRRTPGLRREEVAVVAGIGTSWYAWLEQGRDINVSENVARAIGRALRLDHSEFRYLYQLLGISLGQDAGLGVEPLGLDAGQVVDEWLPNPALVVDELWNLIDFNASARIVFGIGPGDRNLLESFFTNEKVRSRYSNPERVEREAVAQFRAAAAGRYNDPGFGRLIASLCSRSERFAALWRSHEVLGSWKKRKEIDHPDAGRLSFDVHAWRVDGADDIRLFLHLPCPASDTRVKLETLLRKHEPVVREAQPAAS
ncbi:helix-turn-helix transcriptional regulator [Amycolatopsis sp., V23-08]|uniref:Helix-turn-helix transcriptional regulator n=1 Tax=Amycolatopsis heterodermiae TaxID=3110235 RepID=A0ABU5R032_9PSEU|nr:helix-turn-helix transcriptional regulator [Amycolatopsis sp., V23-08]MEA5359094.1 helix-turn-helix transcriptional regulator [Amycolatopsis sp., V23-08]